MKNLLPFIISFFLPGIGQFLLKDFRKGGIILFSYIISTYLILNLDFLNLIPFWFPHIIIMIWAIFGVYDIIEERDGKKSATRYLAFSLLIVIVLFPITLTLLTTGIFKGAEFEDRLAGVIEITLSKGTVESISKTTLEIDSLTVSPLFFKQGIASQLIEFVLQNKVFKYAIVETAAVNQPAIKLYEKHGFRVFKQFIPDHGIEKVALKRN